MLRSKTRSLTLLELVVVLFILVAVAGIAIPSFVNLNQQQHGATGAANIGRLDNSMRVAETAKGTVGAPGFDSLISDNAGTDRLIPYMMYGGNGLSILDLSDGGTTQGVTHARIASALVAAGITSVKQMLDDVSTTGDATFDNVTATDIDITTAPAGRVVAITDFATFQSDLTLDSTKCYVLFGFGNDSGLQGQVLAESPVFVPMIGSSRTRYSNLIVLYEIPASGPAVAKYAASAMPMSGGLLGINHHLKVYHQGRDS